MSNEVEELRKRLGAVESFIMEGLQKRLEAVEVDTGKLRRQDLDIAKMTGMFLNAVVYGICSLSLKGDELKLFTEFWQRREEVTAKQIRNSQAPKQVFDIITKFYEELANYITPTKVATADKAMEIAHSFIKKYVPVALPMKAEREGDVWLVDIDVGALAVKMAKVKVDARTGDILSYEIPPK